MEGDVGMRGNICDVAVIILYWFGVVVFWGMVAWPRATTLTSRTVTVPRFKCLARIVSDDIRMGFSGLLYRYGRDWMEGHLGERRMSPLEGPDDPNWSGTRVTRM